jgi:hypothetical protein
LGRRAPEARCGDRFTVPRKAVTREYPVYCPDVLGSAWGCKAHLLAPSRLLDPVLRLLGYTTEVQTAVAQRGGEGEAHVASAARVRDTRAQDGAVRFALHYDAGYAAYTTVMPIARPAQVTVDGTVLPEAADSSAEGWQHSPELRCLTLRLAFGREPRRVRVQPAGDPWR